MFLLFWVVPIIVYFLVSVVLPELLLVGSFVCWINFLLCELTVGALLFMWLIRMEMVGLPVLRRVKDFCGILMLCHEVLGLSSLEKYARKR